MSLSVGIYTEIKITRKNKHYKEQYMSPNVYFDKFLGKTDVYKIK